MKKLLIVSALVITLLTGCQTGSNQKTIKNKRIYNRSIRLIKRKSPFYNLLHPLFSLHFVKFLSRRDIDFSFRKV